LRSKQHEAHTKHLHTTLIDTCTDTATEFTGKSTTAENRILFYNRNVRNIYNSSGNWPVALIACSHRRHGQEKIVLS